ncbi:UNVERIFIED_CONTAM: hypothetical protein FKN15_028314 [Acipenser sinensis]
MNIRCPPKRVPSAARFFTLCRLTVKPPQSYSVGGQRSSVQLTGKPAGAQPDYRGRWCAGDDSRYRNAALFLNGRLPTVPGMNCPTIQYEARSSCCTVPSLVERKIVDSDSFALRHSPTVVCWVQYGL